MKAPVDVVVVTWNAAGTLGPCLESLARQDPPPATVRVVDNASTDGSADLARRFPDVEVTALDSNLGYCTANNIGIRLGRGPLVLLLNPDVWLEPGFVGTLAGVFEDPGVGIACGKLLRWDQVTLDSAGQRLGWTRRPVDRGYGRRDRGQYDRAEDVFGACGAALMARRTLLESLDREDGFIFDDAYFAFYEDLDLAWRARRRGWRVRYEPTAVGYHARGATAKGGPGPKRYRALLRRSPVLRYHALKNRYLTLIRNETPGGFLRSLPFLLAWDAALLALCAVRSPGVLARLLRDHRRFVQAWRRRRVDLASSRNQTPSCRPAGPE